MRDIPCTRFHERSNEVTEQLTPIDLTAEQLKHGVSIADFAANPGMNYETAASKGYEGSAEDWNAFRDEYLASLPKEGYSEPMDLTAGKFVDVPAIWQGQEIPHDGLVVNAMTMIYPPAVRPANYSSVLSSVSERRNAGLVKFFMDLVPTPPEQLSIYTYQGLVDEEEVRYVRFQTEANSHTFVVRESRFERWMEAVLDDATIEWCVQPQALQSMKDRGFMLNVSKLPIEYPMSFYQTPMFEKDPMEGLVNGDFIAVENLTEKLKLTISNKLGLATLKANVLVNADIEKDHDLYLAFKAIDNFKHLNVTLDKVYPKLPENGQISLGEDPTTIFEWNGKDKKVLVAVKQINNYRNQINREIDGVRAIISQHPVIQAVFDDKLKTILYAASHFTKRIYGFGIGYGKALVQEVANDVIRKLTAKSATGVNIGLDLNSWIVWEYKPGVPPERITEEDLDFVNTLFNRYTEGFIEALYAFLINLGNPLIKPYDYREVADLSDGIALGTIRRVK
jgi:hypothetical protein